jgi:hypothetical protein
MIVNVYIQFFKLPTSVIYRKQYNATSKYASRLPRDAIMKNNVN